MTLTPELVIAANKASLETLVGLTNKAFFGVEQLIELNLAAAKTTLADSQKQTDAVLNVKDAQELLALQAGFFQPLLEKTVSYTRHLVEITTGTGSHFQNHWEAKVAEAQKAFHDALDNASKNAPAGSEAAMAALKTAVSVGNNALESVQKVVKQATDVAATNYKNLTDTALTSSKSASKKR